MSWKWKSRGLVVLLVVAFPVVAVAAAPEATTEFVFDILNSRKYDRQTRAFREADARYDSQIRETYDRIAVKERLIAELIEGRQSFAEVVRQFELLNSTMPVPFIMIPNEVPGISDEERAAYSVLFYVSQRGTPLGHDLPRFAAEYESRYGRPFHLGQK